MKLRELLSKKLTREQMKYLRASYDMVGDIAVIEIPFELESVERLIGESILEINKNIKTVAKKSGAHEGEYRLQDLEVIAGENKLTAFYKEAGVNFEIDLSKTYFSVRLGSERLRIAKLVQPGERILVVGAGSGAYPLVISNNSPAFEITGLEMNVFACKMFEKNAELNKVKNVKVFCGDFFEFQSSDKFDRVILAIPDNSFVFLEKISEFCKMGTNVHFYCFSHEDEFDESRKKIMSVFKNAKFTNIVKCGQRKARIWRICIDFGVLS